MLARTLARSASTSASASAGAGSSSSSMLSAYLLLSRPPRILRSPTPFESAYHGYNAKLQRVLSQPFPREVYFKKGSAAENKFIKEEKERQSTLTARNVSSKGTPAATGEDDSEKAASVAAEVSEVEGQDLYRTLPRRTKADEENQTDSLERSLDRNLFLLVKGGDMGKDWTLPFAEVDKNGDAVLHKVAPQAVHTLLGNEMDIWMVSNLPVAVLPSVKGGERSYVMRGHILAGQPDLSNSSAKGVEFAWLTKEEIQQRVGQKHWDGIQDLLSV